MKVKMISKLIFYKIQFRCVCDIQWMEDRQKMSKNGVGKSFLVSLAKKKGVLCLHLALFQDSQKFIPKQYLQFSILYVQNSIQQFDYLINY